LARTRSPGPHAGDAAHHAVLRRHAAPSGEAGPPLGRVMPGVGPAVAALFGFGV